MLGGDPCRLASWQTRVTGVSAPSDINHQLHSALSQRDPRWYLYLHHSDDPLSSMASSLWKRMSLGANLLERWTTRSWITLLPPISAGVHPCPRGGRLPPHWQGQSHTHNRRHTTVSCQARRGSVGGGASGGGEYELIIHSTSLNCPLYKDSDYMHSTQQSPANYSNYDFVSQTSP